MTWPPVRTSRAVAFRLWRVDRKTMSVTLRPCHHPAMEKVIAQFKVAYPEIISIVNPGNCVVPHSYEQDSHRIFDFEVREDDAWVISYPKCGNTWTQEMVWLLTHDLNYQQAKETDISNRSPFLEYSCFNHLVSDPVDSIDVLNKASSPRVIKTHLPKDLLPLQLWTKKPKIIYVVRDPKDVLVSYFYHHKSGGFDGSLETFAEAFLEDVVLYSPFWENVLDFWKIKESYVLFNTYEEMKADLPGVIRKTAAFLNKELTDEQVDQLANHLSFDSMKKNKAVNKEQDLQTPFLRKGVSGGWKVDMAAELAARVDAWTKKKLEGSDFPFYV